jgi:hypothetical protein
MADSIGVATGHRGAFRDVPYMGVIYVVAEAMKLGFTNGDPDWCNLGQGQPEVGRMDGAPARVTHVDVPPQDHAYGPVGGTTGLREAIAGPYNRLFRTSAQSQYTADNVSVASGGRLVLSRLLAALGSIRVGYQTPDYTAYEDMLAYHAHRLSPVHLPTTADDAFKVSASRFAEAVRAERLGAFLLSNPCNPTGQVLQGEELREYVGIARDTGCALLLDEFYSHFIYDSAGSPAPGPVSAATWISDVDRDPVMLVDGLTKNFRYPGWRIGWVVGPASAIEQINRAASAIDGGPGTLAQRAAIQLLEPALADQETGAVRNVFARKHRLMRDALLDLGIRIPHAPRGTFYIWGDISGLKPPFNDADALFRAALQKKVMLVPGRFFDVNPGQHRPPDASYAQWVRFSFGPPEDNVRLGLKRLADLLG